MALIFKSNPEPTPCDACLLTIQPFDTHIATSLKAFCLPCVEGILDNDEGLERSSVDRSKSAIADWRGGFYLPQTLGSVVTLVGGPRDGEVIAVPDALTILETPMLSPPIYMKDDDDRIRPETCRYRRSTEDRTRFLFEPPAVQVHE